MDNIALENSLNQALRSWDHDKRTLVLDIFKQAVAHCAGICTGLGTPELNLEYKFDPSWENYRTLIIFTLVLAILSATGSWVFFYVILPMSQMGYENFINGFKAEDTSEKVDDLRVLVSGRARGKSIRKIPTRMKIIKTKTLHSRVDPIPERH